MKAPNEGTDQSSKENYPRNTATAPLKTKYLKKKGTQIKRQQKGLFKTIATSLPANFDPEQDLFDDFDLAQMMTDSNKTVNNEPAKQQTTNSNSNVPPVSMESGARQSPMCPCQQCRRSLLLNQYKVCCSMNIRRNVFALAVRLHDLFAALRQIPRNNAIFIALGCLTLAMKLQDSGSVPNSLFNDILPKQKFEQAETQILKCIKFKLYNETYCTHLWDLLNCWEAFVQMHHSGNLHLVFWVPFWRELTLSSVGGPLLDKLECLSLVWSSNNFKSKDVCLNLLFIDIFQKKRKWESAQEDQLTKLVHQAYKDRGYLQLFAEFQKYLLTNASDREVSSARLSYEVGLFLVPFFQLDPKEATINPLPLNDQTFKMKSNPAVMRRSEEILRTMTDNRE